MGPMACREFGYEKIVKRRELSVYPNRATYGVQRNHAIEDPPMMTDSPGYREDGVTTLSPGIMTSAPRGYLPQRDFVYSASGVTNLPPGVARYCPRNFAQKGGSKPMYGVQTLDGVAC